MYKAFFFLFFVVASAVGARFDEYDWRVVGGQQAPEGAYPYQASLRSTANSHFCGGSIITRRTILTAAHCVVGRTASSTLVVVGTNHISTGGTRYNAASVRSHPSYNSQLISNDVGLVIVTADIALTSIVQPIALGDTTTGGGVTVTLTGWGRTSYPGNVATMLQVLQLRTLTVDDCRTRLSSVGSVFDSSLCTFTKTGEGACHGDSGGPLVNSGKVVGIVSWGSPCARGYPDVFARVSSFLTWINDNKQ